MPDFTKAELRLTVETEAITWMAVHGNLLLALRHPHNCGPSGQVVMDFVHGLGELIVKSGLLSRDELNKVLDGERIARGAGN